jgi:hypothetical protein
MKNLYESFKDYVQVEMLDGENKYQAEGLRPARCEEGHHLRVIPSRPASSIEALSNTTFNATPWLK